MSDQITFLGHSAVLLELGGLRLLTDPLLRRRFLHARRVVPEPRPDVLHELDALLVSHLHQDHLDFPSIRALPRATRIVAPVGGARVLRRRRFRAVTELRPGESTALGPFELRATDAVHDGRRLPVGPAIAALGFLIRGPAPSVYFAGDTDLHPRMADLAGEVDVALLPVGGWGPRVGRGHLDPERAARAAAMIRPRIVVPIHWGTYQRVDLVGRRPDLLADPPRRLVAEARRVAPGVEVRVLRPGETLALQ